ncbi:MAG: SGNH/GDSL hydrolase family protein [Bacteroidota bacterium]
MIETSYAQDWANSNHFKTENEKLGKPKTNENRIVFMGNSITESWGSMSPEFFSGKPYINRGIGGQTTPQMLIRFRPDVIDLKPKVVVILAGTNDIAGNTGPATLKMISDNIFSMAELAKTNGIKVILSSILPAFDYPWKPGLQPAEKIIRLNELIKNYAIRNGIEYLDYHSSMSDQRNGLKDEYTYDGVHPNKKGYQVMAPLAEEAIKNVLN